MRGPVAAPVALSVGGFHFLPDSIIATLVVAVCLYGIYIAYTGNPVRGKHLSAIGAITAANVVVFVLQGVPLDPRLPIVRPFYDAVVAQNGFVPAHFVHGRQWWSPLTQMFVHSGALHLFFNMLFLWVIGVNIEERIGRRRFVVAYVLAGFAATAVTLLGVLYIPDTWQSRVPYLTLPTWFSPNIGASGAVYGIIGFAIGAFPREKIMIPTPIIMSRWSPPVAALILIVINVFFTLGSNTAWWAHLAGMFLGIAWGIGWRLRQPDQPDVEPEWGSSVLVQESDPFRER